MDVDPNDLRTLLLCSFRYALGRATYMPQQVQELIKKHVDVLETWMLQQMDKDIGDAAQRGGLGMDVDVRGWLEFRQWLRDTLGRREYGEKT